MKSLFTTCLMALLCAGLNAQSFQLPKYEFKTAEDYSTFEGDFIKAVEWLESVSPNEYENQQKEVSAFLMQWMTGTPTVSMEMNAEVVTFMETPELLILYLAGWSRYAIQNKSKDKVAGSLAGVETAMKYYTEYKAVLGKNKHMEKYLKMKEKNKLEKFMKGKF